jgi:hypothetical protein
MIDVETLISGQELDPLTAMWIRLVDNELSSHDALFTTAHSASRLASTASVLF